MAAHFEGLFYDLLSGSFEPISDPKGRRHTLARLAVAATDKGETIPFSDNNGNIQTLYYIPTWAPNTQCGVTKEDDLVQAITINSPQGNLEVMLAKDTAHISSYLLAYTTQIILQLGPQLDSDRIQVANLAETFFNNAHITA